MDEAYGVRISEPNIYYICWEPKLMEHYRIFTLDRTINNETNVGASYMDQIALIGGKKLYIQAESSVEYLPSERTPVKTEGRSFVAKQYLIEK